METNSILTNEYSNNGYQIHLYRGEMTGMWYAYGYSAYGLRLFGKSNGYNSIRGYSKSLQMPCTITSNESVIPLLQNAIEVASQTDTYISLRMPDAINTDAYTKWVNKLKDGISNNDEIIVNGNIEYIEQINQQIEKILESYSEEFKNKELSIINCYDITKYESKVKEIIEKHDKILNTAGEKDKEEYIIKIAN